MRSASRRGQTSGAVSQLFGGSDEPRAKPRRKPGNRPDMTRFDSDDGRPGHYPPRPEAIEGERGEHRERTHRLDEVMPGEVAARQRSGHRHGQPHNHQTDRDAEGAPACRQRDRRDPEHDHIDEERKDAVPRAHPDEAGRPVRRRVADERTDRPPPEARQRTADRDEARGGAEAGERSAGCQGGCSQHRGPLLEPPQGERDEDHIDRRRLAKRERRHEQQPRPEPLPAQHAKDGRGERQHHEDLGVRRQQPRVPCGGEDPVEQRRQNARPRRGEVAPDQVDQQARERHGDERDRVHGPRLVRTEDAKGQGVNPEDARRLVVHPAVGVEPPAEVHQDGDRAVDRLVAVEQAMQELGQVREGDRKAGEDRPRTCRDGTPYAFGNIGTTAHLQWVKPPQPRGGVSSR